MKTKLLSINNLGKYYYSITDQIEAVKDVSFDVFENEFISIVGPSGCGKSTILSILGNLEDKTSGNITFYKDL